MNRIWVTLPCNQSKDAAHQGVFGQHRLSFSGFDHPCLLTFKCRH